MYSGCLRHRGMTTTLEFSCLDRKVRTRLAVGTRDKIALAAGECPADLQGWTWEIEKALGFLPQERDFSKSSMSFGFL